MDRYTCLRELLPVIERALAAKGYVAEAAYRYAVDGRRVTVMTRGAAVIALHEDLGCDMADITVYGSPETGGIGVLEELPPPFPSVPGQVLMP